jgi:hypothetical protein
MPIGPALGPSSGKLGVSTGPSRRGALLAAAGEGQLLRPPAALADLQVAAEQESGAGVGDGDGPSGTRVEAFAGGRTGGAGKLESVTNFGDGEEAALPAPVRLPGRGGGTPAAMPSPTAPKPGATASYRVTAAAARALASNGSLPRSRMSPAVADALSGPAPAEVHPAPTQPPPMATPEAALRSGQPIVWPRLVTVTNLGHESAPEEGHSGDASGSLARTPGPPGLLRAKPQLPPSTAASSASTAPATPTALALTLLSPSAGPAPSPLGPGSAGLLAGPPAGPPPASRVPSAQGLASPAAASPASSFHGQRNPAFVPALPRAPSLAGSRRISTGGAAEEDGPGSGATPAPPPVLSTIATTWAMPATDGCGERTVDACRA